MKHILNIPLLLFLFSLLSCNQQEAQEELNYLDAISFNEDWKFIKGEQENAISPNFDDSGWRNLDLPHDWAIEGPFDNKYNTRCGALPFHGIGWYRKTFHVPSQLEGKKAFVHFEGVMNNGEVWVNGNRIGERPYGYIGFELEMTKHLKYGEKNTIAVKCSPEDLSARWYPGAGIYRDVWVSYKEPIHIAHDGTFITTPKIEQATANVNIGVDLVNSTSENQVITLETIIQNKQGETVNSVSSEVKMKASSADTFKQDVAISDVQRWDLENPYLYKAITLVKKDHKVIDRKVSDFGVREISFTADKGFELNGKQVRLNGVCLHHDQGPLGAAVNYRAKERQLEIMKEMGVNAVRTSHNPPSKAFLDACDRLGLLVIDEAFDNWKMAKVENGYNKFYDEWSETDLRAMIRRDRNHPSIIMWSIGNEILEQTKKDGWKETRRLAQITKEEDTTRPVTAGFNYYPASVVNKLAREVDIPGFNYWPMRYEEILKDHPDWIIYGSETSSCTSSRGVYHYPIETYTKHESKQVTSYDLIGPPWSYPPDLEFDQLAKNPNVLGEFIWTGFDYLGEPTPYGGRDNQTNGYWNGDYPSHSSYFGAADLCGFPKDRYFLYQSQWTTKPMVHVLPHWNWEGKEGDIIPVHAFTNCDEVELIVNGKSFGKKVKGVDLTPIPMVHRDWKSKKPLMSKYRLSWDVPYQAGSIKVIAYKEGVAIVEKEIRTAGKPHHIELSADRNMIASDGKDLSYVTVKVVDKDGNMCPTSSNDIQFTIEGEGLMAGVGNGDPTSITSLQGSNMEVFNGLALAVVKSEKNATKEGFTLKATSNGLESASIQISFKKPVM